MKMIAALVATAAVLATVGAASSGAAAAPRSAAQAAGDSGNASIPFVRFGGIRNWRAPDDSTVFLQGSNGQWYRADLMGRCDGLTFALRIGFQTGGTDTLDNFSNLVVDGQPCPITSLTKINGSPPARKAK